MKYNLIVQSGILGYGAVCLNSFLFLILHSVINKLLLK